MNMMKVLVQEVVHDREEGGSGKINGRLERGIEREREEREKEGSQMIHF